MCTDILDNNCVRIIYLQNDLRVQCRNQHAHFPAIQSKTIPSCKSQRHAHRTLFFYVLPFRPFWSIRFVGFIYLFGFFCLCFCFFSLCSLLLCVVRWVICWTTNTNTHGTFVTVLYTYSWTGNCATRWRSAWKHVVTPIRRWCAVPSTGTFRDQVGFINCFLGSF